MATLGATLSSDTSWGGTRLGAHLSSELLNSSRFGSTLSSATFAPGAPPANTIGTINTLSQFATAANPYTGDSGNYTFYNDKIDRALVYGGAPSQVHDLFAGSGWMYTDIAAIYPTVGSGGLTPTKPSVVLRQNSDTSLYTWLNSYGPPVGDGAEFATDPGLQTRIDDILAIVETQEAAGYVGMMLDDVNPAGINTDNAAGDYVDPRDPRTGVAMTVANWRKYHAELVEAIKAATTKEVVSNMHWYAGNAGYTRGYNDQYIARIIEASDFILLENGLVGNTGDNDVAWTWSFAALREFCDFCHSHGTNLAWFDYSSETSAEYQLAVYFLFNEGADYCGVVLTSGNPATYDTMYDIDLGAATSDRYQWTLNGVALWRRDFDGGFILVNGPGMSTVTAGALGGSYINSAGSTVTTITLTANSGAVLRNP